MFGVIKKIIKNIVGDGSMIKGCALFLYSYNVELCLRIQRYNTNKVFKFIMFALISPFLVLNMILRIICEYTIGYFYVSNIKRRENRSNFEDKLAVVAIAKNEGMYIEEWVAYYKTIGVDRIYLYENNGTDDMKDKLQPFIGSGFVVYHDFPGKAMQVPAYNHAIANYGMKTKYMAMVDCDEFLMPVLDSYNLSRAIEEIMKSSVAAGGLGINWCVYGSSGKTTKEPGLLMERFKMRADDQAWNNKLIKTVVNPRLVKKFVSPHFAVYKLGAWCIDSKHRRVRTWYINDVDFSVLRCNHYFCKSVEEFKNKQARGLADRSGVKYDMTKFDKYNVNNIKDVSMDIYIQRVKKIIEGGK